MLVKTSELTGAALDWVVAKCEGTLGHYVQPNEKRGTSKWEITPSSRRYSTDWSQGGPIIERERIAIVPTNPDWWAEDRTRVEGNGSTPLIAAMRCYVKSKFGDTVEIPDELL